MGTAQILLLIYIALFYFLLGRGTRWKASVFLFVAFAQIKALFPKSQQFLGFISVDNIFPLLVIFSFIETRRPGELKFSQLDAQKKNALYLALVFWVFLVEYITLKDWAVFGSMNVISLQKTVLNRLLIIYVMFLIFRRLDDPRIHEAVEKAVFFGVILIVLSMIFVNQLNDIGLFARKWDNRDELRISGISGINPNAVAALFAVVYSFCLVRLQSRRKLIYFAIPPLMFVGIMLAASRTGLFLVFAMTAFSLLASKTPVMKKVAYSLLFLIAFLFIFQKYGQVLQQRIERRKESEYLGMGMRMEYWKMYLLDTIDNPHYFLIGNTRRPTYSRSAHNFYVENLFKAGLIWMLAGLAIIYRILRFRRDPKNKGGYSPVLIVIPQLLLWISGTDPVFEWLILLIAMSPGIPPPAAVKKNPEVRLKLEPRFHDS